MRKEMFVFAEGVILILLFIGSVSGAGISVGEPEFAGTYNEVITLPVSIIDADDIVGFSIIVGNTIPGVSVTVNETVPQSQGTYVINSEANQASQHVVWFATNGVTAEEMLIFSLDVIVQDTAVQLVPISLTVEEIVSDSRGSLPQSECPVIGVEHFVISDNLSGSVSSGEVTDTGNAENQTPIVPDPSDVPEELPSVSDTLDDVPVFEIPASAQSPGFSVGLSIMSVLVALACIRR